METPKGETSTENDESRIQFKCIAPKTSSVWGETANEFARLNQSTMFCHLRFSRPMVDGDNVEIKVVFHNRPTADGQCLVSVTPPELQNVKTKYIVRQNPSVVDPTTSWISTLSPVDYRRTMRFGMKYDNGSIQLRTPGEEGFVPFHYVQKDHGDVWIDVFFCEFVKSVSLRTPLFPRCPSVVLDVEIDDLLNEPELIGSLVLQQHAKIVILG